MRPFDPEGGAGDGRPYCAQCARIEFGRQPFGATSPRLSSRRQVVRVSAIAAAAAAVGLVMAGAYEIATLDLFCSGGTTESGDVAILIGTVLWLAVVVAAGFLRWQFGWLLAGFTGVYLVALVVLAASSSAIWGPKSCGGVGP